MKKNFTTILFLVLLLAFGACTPQAAPSPTAADTIASQPPATEPSATEPASKLSATLSELSGKVEIKNPGSDSFAAAEASSILEVNGQIQTGDDGRVRLDLSSGTIIRVAPSSFFTLTANEESEDGLLTKLKVEIGKVFIILNGGSMDVETPSGVASVRGSYLKVEVDPVTGDIYLTCLEGNCSAENPSGSVDFTDGQKVILLHRDPVRGTWTIPNVELMDLKDFQEWLDANPEARELFDQAMATLTAMPPATEPPAQTVCLNVTEPTDGASLPFQGEVNFQWEAKPGASKYILTFTDANGKTVSFETEETNLKRFIETLPDAGAYQWTITALGENGEPICVTDPVTFTKPSSVIEEKEKQEDPTPIPPTQPPACDPYNCQGSCPSPVYCG